MAEPVSRLHPRSSAKKRAMYLGTIVTGLAAFGLATVLVGVSVAGGAPAAIPSERPTSPPAGPVAELAIAEPKAVASAADISLPIDAFRPDPASQNVVYAAEGRLIESCMQRFDIEWHGPWTTAALQNRDYDRLFGVINLADAKKDGYFLPGEGASESGKGNSNGEKLETNVSEADFSVAFFGDAPSLKATPVPEGGCVGEARRALGDDFKLQSLIDEAVNYGLTQSDRDPRVVETFAAWSTCMSDKGYSYGTPGDAVNDPRGDKALAIADVECKIKTNLTGLRVAVAAAWQDRFIQEHASQLKEANASFESQLSIAKAIR